MRKLAELLIFIGMVSIMVGCTETDATTKQEQGDNQSTQEEKEKTSNDMEEMLGIDYEILNYIDMETAVREIEEELGVTEEFSLDVVDAVSERYGYLNGKNYLEYRVPGDDIDEYTKRQLVNMMAYNLWRDNDDNNEIVSVIDDIKVFPTTSFITYENSVQYDAPKDNINPQSVLNGGELVVGDTKGFHDGNNLKVGYPSIDEGFLIDSELRENLLEVSFAVYIEEDITIAEFLEEIDGIEVEVNGEQAVPLRTLTKEGFMENVDMYLEDENYAYTGVSNEDELKELFEHELEYGHVYSINDTIQKVYEKLEGIESKSDIDFNQYMIGYKEFLEQIKQEKILLGGTIQRIRYEIDKRVVLGDYEGRSHDYFMEGYETPIITVDGVDMNTEAVSITSGDVLINGEGVYYEE